MDVDPQLWRDASEEQLLKMYFDKGYEYKVILCMLKEYHGKITNLEYHTSCKTFLQNFYDTNKYIHTCILSTGYKKPHD